MSIVNIAIGIKMILHKIVTIPSAIKEKSPVKWSPKYNNNTTGKKAGANFKTANPKTIINTILSPNVL